MARLRLFFGNRSASASVTGTLATTNANDTLAASGTTTVTGSLASTNANDTSSASGTTTAVGSLATTNANDTSSASGSTTVAGSLATTNANDTVSASGDVGGTVSGSVSYTNVNDSVAATGTTTVVGSLAQTNVNDTVSASGTTTIVGTLNTVNSNDTVVASGASGSVTGTLAYTNNNDALTASGTSGTDEVRRGGDDAPLRVVYKPRKKTLEEQPNKHLQSIIDKAVDEVLGVEKQETARTVKQPVIKLLDEEKPVSPVFARTPVEPKESIIEEVERVTALLAQYHDQVSLAQLQEDEELLILVMEMY